MRWVFGHPALFIVTVAIGSSLLAVSGCLRCESERRCDGGPTPDTADFANIAAATALTFFAFTGFENATAPVGKVRNASRIIPLALLGGTAFVVVLYLVAGTGIQAFLPASVVALSPAPFADVLAAHWGHGAGVVAAFGIAVAAIGCLNGLS